MYIALVILIFWGWSLIGTIISKFHLLELFLQAVHNLPRPVRWDALINTIELLDNHFTQDKKGSDSKFIRKVDDYITQLVTYFTKKASIISSQKSWPLRTWHHLLTIPNSRLKISKKGEMTKENNPKEMHGFQNSFAIP